MKINLLKNEPFQKVPKQELPKRFPKTKGKIK